MEKAPDKSMVFHIVLPQQECFSQKHRRPHTFKDIDNEIISTVILSSSTDSRKATVSYCIAA